MTHGGKREGAGAKLNPASKRQSGERIGALLTPEAAATLRPYPKARALELLASGLALGAGNVGELTTGEWDLLRAACSGTYLDALTVRHLAEEVQALSTPGGALAAKMRTWGDWELLHVALRLS